MRAASRIRKFHRYLSLVFLSFWLMQVLSGLLITFRWELDDGLLGRDSVAFDVQAFSASLQQIQADGRNRVFSAWASGGQPGRYDVYLEREGVGDQVIRLNGDGEILRVRNEDQWFGAGGIYDTATTLHANLFAGDAGHWIIGISGLLLVTNIVFGLKLAWPRRGQWRRALTRRPAGAPTARIYGWHRMLGLWLGGFGLLVVSLGALLSLSEPLEDALGWSSPVPPNAAGMTPVVSGPYPVAPGQAVESALSLHPGAEFSGMYPPDDEEPWYTVRLLSVDEPGQKYGKTAVLIDPKSGAVLLDHAAADYPPARRLVNSLFPLHTGQIAGLPGRILVVITGAWLLTMMVLGFGLYLKRQKP